MNKRADSVEKLTQFKLWNEAQGIALFIYAISKNFPDEEKYGMTSQMRRAAHSIHANIAEGFGRYYFKDKIRFYYQARGSAYEVQSFLYITKELKLNANSNIDDLIDEIENVIMKINSLIKALKTKFS